MNDNISSIPKGLSKALKETRPINGNSHDEGKEAAAAQWNQDVYTIANYCNYNFLDFNIKKFYKDCGGLFN